MHQQSQRAALSSSSSMLEDSKGGVTEDVALNGPSIDWFGTFDDLGGGKDFALGSPFLFSPLQSLNSGKRSVTFRAGTIGAFSPGFDAFSGSLVAPFSGGSSVLGSASSINRGLQKNEIVQKKVNNRKFFHDRSDPKKEMKVKRKKSSKSNKNDPMNYHEVESNTLQEFDITQIRGLPIPHLLKTVSGKGDGKGSLSTINGTPLINLKDAHFFNGMKSTTKSSKWDKDFGGMKCNCKKSRCLKLYCECFSAKRLCDSCNCIDCCNIEGSEELKIKLEKNKEEAPLYFTHPSIAKQPTTSNVKTTYGDAHTMFCNCKQSQCLKKYCECYQKTFYCSSYCKCTSCKNNPYENPNHGEGPLTVNFTSTQQILQSMKINSALGDQSPKKKRQSQPKGPDITYPLFGKDLPQQSKITTLRILDFLDSKDIYNCSIVSKLWCSIATDDALWE